MNRVRLAFLSLTGTVPSGRDAEYLEWHAMDHMPEQYGLPGMLNGQRWRSTPGCRRARAAESDELAVVENVVCYLMGDPPDTTLDEFIALGRTLADKGRYPEAVPSRQLGAYELLAAHAAPRALVSADVVPWRPNLGIYLLVEKINDRASAGPFLQDVQREFLPALLDVPGVAGVWWFGTSPRYRRDGFTTGDYRITVCYLDSEPEEVGAALRPVVEKRWAGAPVEPCLAAPFESVVQWNWRRLLTS